MAKVTDLFEHHGDMTLRGVLPLLRDLVAEIERSPEDAPTAAVVMLAYRDGDDVLVRGEIAAADLVRALGIISLGTQTLLQAAREE